MLATLLALITCAASFLVPYWVRQEFLLTVPSHAGLLVYCLESVPERCTWFFENDYEWLKQLPDWMHAAQGLFTCGIVILLIVLVSLCVQLCECGARRCLNRWCTVLLVLAFLEIGLALGVYGYMAYDKVGVDVSGSRRFLWGYWAGVAGEVFTLVAIGANVFAGLQNTVVDQKLVNQDLPKAIMA